jgi:hypothetical protein
MLQSCLIDILTIYNDYTVYEYNFSHFDYYLIITLLKDQILILIVILFIKIINYNH